MNKVLSLLFATAIAQETTEIEVVEENAQVPLPACLYCARMDNLAGFLVSYSYCDERDECLKDAYSYLNRPCDTKWR